MNKISIKKTALLLLCLSFPQLALSQTPSELALLSLNELMILIFMQIVQKLHLTVNDGVSIMVIND